MTENELQDKNELLETELLDEEAEDLPRGPVHQIGEEALLIIFGLLKNLKIHDKENAILSLLTEDLMDVSFKFREAVGENLQVQIYADEFFVNTRLLRMDHLAYSKLRELLDLFKEMGLGALRLGVDTTGEDITAFLQDGHEAMKPNTPSIRSKRYGDFHVIELHDEDVDYRSFPAREATYLYTTLLRLYGEIRTEFHKGNYPSFLPIKRLMSRMIESMATRNHIYQFLNSIRDYEKPLDSVRFDVAITIDALGFGITQKASRGDVMALGLASIAARLFDTKKPLVAVGHLLRCEGFGDLARPLVYGVSNYCRVWRDKEPSRDDISQLSKNRIGQIIALAEVYQFFIATGRERGQLAPTNAVARLLKKHPPALEKKLVIYFAQWKGRYPLGAPLFLDTGELTVLLGYRIKNDEAIALTLAHRGQKEGLLSLGNNPKGRIKGTPKPSEVGLNLRALEHKLTG